MLEVLGEGGEVTERISSELLPMELITGDRINVRALVG
ncbi:hypothetical protein L21SP2_3091 [Salinispira pacifica]|uniref:Uncharacterized protein n=1 Tax=Salinispira pacifica TaxID=1307761 RepID=V5WLA3_9SPIO|nr:hypothetical protein L21SP2_3091 [Salinispira pacifica]